MSNADMKCGLSGRAPIRNMGTRRAFRLALAAACILQLAGCDPVTRHKVLSTLFDGVPSLPPPEQFCSTYAEERLAAYREEVARKSSDKHGGKKGSQHTPYVERQCKKCHDKSAENGLAASKEKICFLCHEGFITGTSVHGPVAVGACLSCHEPHSSNFPSLLKKEKGSLCLTCHTEKRLAPRLHQTAGDAGMLCVDCHDPHFSDAPYFLK